MSKQTFYVTTPIYYGTAKPHLGSLYSTLIADVASRWQHLSGKETYFLTGTDEHGQKIMQAAAKAGKEPQEFVDSFIAAYQETWNTYHIDYQQFIRTTDPRHIKRVQHVITTLMNKGDIYKGTYDGWYCTPCETFVTASTKDETPLCPTCERTTQKVSEESYFFRLSAYQDRLLEWYKHNPDFISPKERMNEVVRFVESGLKDLSMSRTSISWGVPFPHDPEHVVYVWVDALCNYITAIGYGDPAQEAFFEKWWPAQLQVLGKDIVRFHAVYWPALLMAADLALPKQLLVHGWIQVNQQKMSKSLGNIVDPMELAQHYGAEPVRYYLMRKIPVNADGDFSTGALEQTITSDLANDLGNLLNRMVSLADRYKQNKVVPALTWSQKSRDLHAALQDTIDAYKAHMDLYEYHLALARLWKFIKHVNAYFHDQEPWKAAKTDLQVFTEIISATCHSLRAIALLVWPIMPKKMEELLGSLGRPLNIQNDTIASLEREPWQQTFVLKKVPTLFQKKDGSETQQKETSTDNAKASAESFISIDDVMKVDLRVGTIISAESVPKSDKLIKLQVDCGDALGTKQIFAGVRKWYHPEDLLGKQGVFVVNLKPRKMLGQLSEGMMLFAEDETGKLHPINPEGFVPNGTRLR